MFGCFISPGASWYYKLSAQEHVTISGYVRDSGTGEDLIRATVQLVGSSIGTVTNLYGFYSLTVPKDETHLQISYIVYEAYPIKKTSHSKLDDLH